MEMNLKPVFIPSTAFSNITQPSGTSASSLEVVSRLVRQDDPSRPRSSLSGRTTAPSP